MSHKNICFSWWWAHSRPKHVEKRNKHIKKNCAPSSLYLQDYAGMHDQQNVKHTFLFILWHPRGQTCRFTSRLMTGHQSYKTKFTICSFLYCSSVCSSICVYIILCFLVRFVFFLDLVKIISVYWKFLILVQPTFCIGFSHIQWP